MNVDDRIFGARDWMPGHVQHASRLKLGQRDRATRGDLQETTAVHPTTACAARRVRTNIKLGSTNSQDRAQKHISMHHQSMFGTSSSFGAIDWKSTEPSPNGRCVLVSSPCSVPSESIRCIAPIRPRSLSRNSDAPPGRISLAPCWREPTTAHIYACAVSNRTRKFGCPTAWCIPTTSDGLLNA